jgi:arginine/lysine/ornithine decarboxylase
MIACLKAFERAASAFPDSENEIQGLYRETGEDGAVRFHTYVVRE